MLCEEKFRSFCHSDFKKILLHRLQNHTCNFFNYYLESSALKNMNWKIYFVEDYKGTLLVELKLFLSFLHNNFKTWVYQQIQQNPSLHLQKFTQYLFKRFLTKIRLLCINTYQCIWVIWSKWTISVRS